MTTKTSFLANYFCSCPVEPKSLNEVLVLNVVLTAVSWKVQETASSSLLNTTVHTLEEKNPATCPFWWSPHRSRERHWGTRLKQSPTWTSVPSFTEGHETISWGGHSGLCQSVSWLCIKAVEKQGSDGSIRTQMRACPSITSPIWSCQNGTFQEAWEKLKYTNLSFLLTYIHTPTHECTCMYTQAFSCLSFIHGFGAFNVLFFAFGYAS